MNSLRYSKETLGNGFSVTILAGYVKFMFKILDFYYVKSKHINICIQIYILENEFDNSYLNIYYFIQ